MRDTRSTVPARSRNGDSLVPLVGGWAFLVAAAILALYSVSQAAPPQEQKTPKAAATAAQNREFEILLDTLVLHDGDVEGKFYKSGVLKRIDAAAFKLHVSGKESWPVLIRHLDDQRPSIPAAQVTGPYTVGHQCHYILRCQIVSYPEGYLSYKGSHPGNLNSLFQPNLKEWLTKRLNKSVEQIQVETVEYVLNQEKADPKPDPQAIELLEKHLVTLRQRAATPQPPPPRPVSKP